MKFHSPYHFIPVDTNKTETVHWKEHEDLTAERNHYLRHDYWHPGGESGRITCRITCRSPLVIGGEQIPGDKKNPGMVIPYLHPNGTPAIPGNSLRGMISSLAEALSQSAMRVLTSEKESPYSVRKPARGKQKMSLGLLYMKDKLYRVLPLDNQENVGDYRSKDRDTRFIKSQETYQHRENSHPVYRDAIKGLNNRFGAKGILYIRASDEESRQHMPKKWHETFIPWREEIDEQIADGTGAIVPADVIETTENILRMRHKADDEFPQLPKGYRRNLVDKDVAIIQDGDLIYYSEKGGVVTELSYSAIWRRPVSGSLYHAFERTGGKNSLPWNKKRLALTPAEAIFGVVEDEPEKDKPARNIASRVRFTDATPERAIILAREEVTLKVLASPKPPSPAMYFSTVHGYVAKDKLDMNRHTPNGRKQYLSHPKSNNTWETEIKPASDTDHNWRPHLKCTPIPKESRFSFQIHYENLSKAELGLLRTALEPGKTDTSETLFIHRLGLGKPLGLGNITLEIEQIERIKRTQRYHAASLTDNRYSPVDLDKEPVDHGLIDEQAHKILQTLGNPENIEYDISYPYSKNKDQVCQPETKGYLWFMENEGLDSAQQYLKPIEPGRPIPSLNSSHPRIELPSSVHEMELKPHEIKRAIMRISRDITINGVSLSDYTVYLDSNQDIDKLKNNHGKIIITLRGNSITCISRPQQLNLPT